MREGAVDQKSWQSFKDTEVNIIATVCAAVSDNYAALDDSATRVAAKVEQAYLLVKGNRPGGAEVTWSDLRLILAADLKILLNELETA